MGPIIPPDPRVTPHRHEPLLVVHVYPLVVAHVQNINVNKSKIAKKNPSILQTARRSQIDLAKKTRFHYAS